MDAYGGKTMMNVGYGVTLLSRCMQDGGIDGIGSYTKELLNALQTVNVNLTAVSFGVEIPVELKNSVTRSIQLSGFSKPSLLSALTGIPFSDVAKLKKSNQIDLFHSTDHRIPKFSTIPVIATLMDAIPLSNPEWVDIRFAKLKFALWRKSAQWADQILTISEYSKQQIAEHFKIPEEKISVIPLGVDKRWFIDISSYVIESVKKKYHLPSSFFLSVGTLQPRKNIERVIQAHEQLDEKIRKDVPLVIVGRHGWMCDDLIQKLESGIYKNTIIWLKNLPDEDLMAVVKMATALVFVSLSEGFGLPVLESFAAGTPVITSNTTSLPEVAGDAAILVNPYNSEEINYAMLKTLDDKPLVSRLVNDGLNRAKVFSWDRTARLTAEAYLKLINS